MVRNAETMPVETLPPRSKGAPMTTTESPTEGCEEEIVKVGNDWLVVI